MPGFAARQATREMRMLAVFHRPAALPGLSTGDEHDG